MQDVLFRRVREDMSRLTEEDAFLIKCQHCGKYTVCVYRMEKGQPVFVREEKMENLWEPVFEREEKP